VSVPQCYSARDGARCLLDLGHLGRHVAVAHGHQPISWALGHATVVPDADQEEALQGALREIEAEARRAIFRHPPLNSPHEAWAVIREEEDELWEHVRADTGRSPEARVEATQIAATAIRYMVNIARGETR
jgi:hypothetical protein